MVVLRTRLSQSPYPHLNAALVSALEFVGGGCLMLGLGTRVFAFLLS